MSKRSSIALALCLFAFVGCGAEALPSNNPAPDAVTTGEAVTCGAVQATQDCADATGITGYKLIGGSFVCALSAPIQPVNCALPNGRISVGPESGCATCYRNISIRWNSLRGQNWSLDDGAPLSDAVLLNSAATLAINGGPHNEFTFDPATGIGDFYWFHRTYRFTGNTGFFPVSTSGTFHLTSLMDHAHINQNAQTVTRDQSYAEANGTWSMSGSTMTAVNRWVNFGGFVSTDTYTGVHVTNNSGFAASTLSLFSGRWWDFTSP